MRSKTIFISLIIVVLVFCLSAGGLAAEKTYNIVFCVKNLTNPVWKETWVGAQKAAAEYKDVNITVSYTTKAENIAEQTSQMEDIILKRPDAIVFVPVDYVAMVPVVEKMNKAGIPVVAYNNRPAGGKFVAYIGFDDVKMSYDVTKHGIEAIGGKGKVIIIEGNPGAITAKDRVRGCLKAVGESPGVEVLASQPGNFNRLVSMQVMENLLQRFKKIDLVCTATDESALGALEAIDAAGRLKEIKVVGMDGTTLGAQAIVQGRLLASIALNPIDAGYIPAKAAIKYLHGEKIPKEIVMPTPVMDKKNASKFTGPLEDRPLSNWDEFMKRKDLVTWEESKP